MFRYMLSSFLAQLIHPKMGHPNYHFAKLFYIFPEAFPLPFSSVSILPWFFCCGPPRRVWSSHCHPWSWDVRPHDIPWFLEAGRNREPTELGQPGYDQIVRQIPALICHFTLCKFAQPRTTFLGDLLCQNVESMFFFFEEEAFLLLHYVFIALSPLTNGDVMSNICSSPVQAWSNQFRHSGASLGTWGAPRGTNPSLGGTLR